MKIESSAEDGRSVGVSKGDVHLRRRMRLLGGAPPRVRVRKRRVSWWTSADPIPKANNVARGSDAPRRKVQGARNEKA
jgi:hypothetical protein